ncbi:MAG: hypothetical protein QXR49_02315, partial [Sulfolobales archaeon]
REPERNAGKGDEAVKSTNIKLRQSLLLPEFRDTLLTKWEIGWIMKVETMRFLSSLERISCLS